MIYTYLAHRNSNSKDHPDRQPPLCPQKMEHYF